MPRDLPGLRWDAERNRYFPINSKPAAPAEKSQLQSQPPTPPSRNTTPSHAPRHRSIWKTTELRKTGIFEHQRALNRHDLLSLHYARTASLREQRLPIFGAVKNFISATTDSGQCYRLIGDNLGWIYSIRSPEDVQDHVQDHWFVESNIDPESEISSINICDSFSLYASSFFNPGRVTQLPVNSATSFGPISKMRLQKLNDPNFSFILTARECHDVRCSHFSNPNEIVVGAKQSAVHITDIFSLPRTRILKAHSDVFSVTRQRDLIYAGTRNGSIHRFDLRIPDNRSIKIPFTNNSRSTVLHMQLIDETHFLTSYMDGTLLMYDVRYARQSNPLLRFSGHVNTHTSRLGIATDPENEFVFAAGQDHRIRGWSLRNGNPLIPPATNPPPAIANNRINLHAYMHPRDPNPVLLQEKCNPLLAVFETPVETMQITRERMDTCLWAGCGDKLYQFNLGCQDSETKWRG